MKGTTNPSSSSDSSSSSSSEDDKKQTNGTVNGASNNNIKNGLSKGIDLNELWRRGKELHQQTQSMSESK